MSGDSWHDDWSHYSDTALILGKSFDLLLSAQADIHNSSILNIFWDELRDHLSACDPIHFQRHGGVGAPAQLIFDYLLPSTTHHLSLVQYCPNDCYQNVVTCEWTLPTCLSEALWDQTVDSVDSVMDMDSVTIESWIDTYIKCKLATYLDNAIPTNLCEHGCNAQILHKIIFVDAPKMFAVEVPPESAPTPLPVVDLTLPGTNSPLYYKLTGIIYAGGYHFTAKFLTSDHKLWYYDGQKNNGHPYLDTDWNPSADIEHCDALAKFNERTAHVYIFSLENEDAT